MTLVIEERCSVRLKISREDFRDTPYTRTHSGGFPHTLGGFVLSVPRDATHRRASQATQFRKVCRSKNSNGRPIPLVKWRTIALVNHYIKILYRPPCSRHLPSTSSPRPLLPLSSRSPRFSRSARGSRRCPPAPTYRSLHCTEFAELFTGHERSHLCACRGHACGHWRLVAEV